ncbi:MAG: phosphotriesterase-related protein [Actinomycetota bacterium]|nr:phosphotriesterase-related protein [Actinomycetota bacterium]
MGQVNTARGPIEAGGLGRTLAHEHVFVLSPDVQQNWPSGFDTEAQVASAVERLRDLHAAGIATIVDLTVVGLGRDIRLVKKVAEQVELNIVVATGLYTYDSIPHYFDYRTAELSPNGVDALEELMLRDFEEGIAGSGIKPGILKCATDEPGLTPGVERVLRAVARVHRKTGMPISTHTHAGTHRGLEQQRIFAEEGVDLSRVVIGHSGDSTDLDYLHELLESGSTLGMDRFGIDLFCPFEQRVATVATLCSEGFASQMVLSHDASCYIDWFDPGLLQVAAPNWHFLHITRDVLPALKERGVTEEQIDQMLVRNPARILDHPDGY